MDWIQRLDRAITAIPRPLRRALVWPLLAFPTFRNTFRVSDLDRQIRSLEAGGDYDQAQRVRQAGLDSLADAFAAPLWRSEGFNLLRLRRDLEALSAFERAIVLLNDQAVMYGVSQPHEIYYGAASAAVQLGDTEKAKGYYRTLVTLVVPIEKYMSAESKVWWRDSLERLRVRLEEPITQ